MVNTHKEHYSTVQKKKRTLVPFAAAWMDYSKWMNDYSKSEEKDNSGWCHLWNIERSKKGSDKDKLKNWDF